MKNFTIEVEIGEDGHSRADCRYPPVYKVYINPNDLEGLGRPHHIAAHEIGHVIAHAFGLQFNRQVNDPGSNEKYHYDENFCIGLEREAWDIAEMMALKNRSLRSYKESFRPLVFNQELKNALP